MSQRPPPHATANMFGYGGSMDMQGVQSSTSQDDTIMTLVDPSMYSAFDTTMHMSLDDDNNVVMSTRPYHCHIAPAPPQGGAPSAPVVQPVPRNAPMPAIMSQNRTADTIFPQPRPDEQVSSMSGALTTTSKPKYGGMPPPQTPIHAIHGAQGSIVTEYTKKRDWAARTAEELADLQQILDQDGRVKYVSPSVTVLTGYTKEEMLDVMLQDLIHPDDVGVYLSEMHDAAATGGTVRLFYRLRKKDGTYGVFESTGHAHIATARFSTNPHNKSHFRQAVFLMSRPYPTKNAELLDSFLEHKIENERLRRRIAELRKEEYEDGGEDAQRSWQDSRSEMMSEDASMSVSTNTTARHAHQARTGASGDGKGMGMQPGDSILNGALTRENLEGAIAGSRQDSIKDKMARYEGHSHAETIEMLTGLRYREGERSHGINMGSASPSLTKGDAGIAIPMDRDPRTGADKKKKIKVAEEYVCTDCGTLDSPEWRKGPSGPKTLCNACGLRWAKKEKKRNARATGGSSSTPATLTMFDR